MKKQVLLTIHHLKEMIKELLERDCWISSIEIYIFGSATRSDKPSDIDLIVIYNKKQISINQVLELRKKLYVGLSVRLDIEIDICLLSDEEKIQSNFIELEQAVQLV